MDTTMRAGILPHDGPGASPALVKTVLRPVSDLVTTLPDPDGNVLGLLQDR